VDSSEKHAAMMGAEKRRAVSAKRVRTLEGVLTAALKAGDKQADELVRLSRVAARQRSVMWRAFSLIKQGRHHDAVAALETECKGARR
jgi:hypothetical protein